MNFCNDSKQNKSDVVPLIPLLNQKKKPHLKTIMVFNFDHFTLISVDSNVSAKRVCPDLKRKYPVFFCIWIQLSNGFSKTTKRGSINQRDEKVWPSSIKIALRIRRLFLGFIRSLVNFLYLLPLEKKMLWRYVLFLTFWRSIRRVVWKCVTLIEWIDDHERPENKWKVVFERHVNI